MSGYESMRYLGCCDLPIISYDKTEMSINNQTAIVVKLLEYMGCCSIKLQT